MIIFLDWLDCARLLAEKHPINRAWFFEMIDACTPLIQSEILTSSLGHSLAWQSEEFDQLLLQRLLKLLEAHEELLDLPTVASTLLNNHSSKSQAWLNKRIDTMVALCLADPQNDKVKYIRMDWTRLHQALNKQGAAMRLSRRRRHIDQPPGYLTSPAYQYLIQQFEAADHREQNRLLSTPKDSTVVERQYPHAGGCNAFGRETEPTV